MMHLGYNTNGLAHHSLSAAIQLLAGLGYESVAITIDHACLNPFADDFRRELDHTSSLLATYGMRSVIETGARYLLDPLHKHEPTLVTRSPQGQKARVAFLCRAIDAAASLKSDCVSLWSGAVRDDASRDDAVRRLCEGLEIVLDYAQRFDVTLGFEPEPGMLIDDMAGFAELADRLPSPRLGLTLDVGHLHCQGELPIAGVIRQWGERLVNVHIEDMRAGVHEHLMFGEGEIDFPPVIAALAEIGYDGGLHVELSRHSHDGPSAARRARDFLNPLIRVVQLP